MFTMFNQCFSAITILFLALEKFARTLLNLSTIGEAMSGAYAQEQLVLQQAKLKALNLEHGTTIGDIAVIPAIPVK